MPAFIKNEPLQSLDPEISRVISLEEERQNRKLILIASESSAPAAVRECMGSVFQNIYAEGYPPEESRLFSQSEILNIDKQLLNFRRYSDSRYYKGVEFADIIEELARRRCAELFANEKFSADEIFVNIQPLSGAPANNAVYQALLEPGDALLGMNLFHGGHLTHGSSVNRSGKLYTAYHYSVIPETERIDYDQLLELAKEKQPKIIIAGYSSYPWSPDWKKYREIANSVSAYLFADISHIAGLVAAGVIPSPVGYADVITFTTHKSLCGPRGACILSFDKKISSKIDKAVFPGEQGGPHVNIFAAMATTFQLAMTKEFHAFQHQIVKNCSTLGLQLAKRNIRIAYGGSDTHLINVDCKSIIGKDGTPLSGDIAARVLDIAGIVVNSNAIPGDKSALQATGIRIGTPWVTQRGLDEQDMIALGDIIADILHSFEPYTTDSGKKSPTRAKVDFCVLETSKLKVRELCDKANDTANYQNSGYPFFYFLDDYDSRNEDSLVSFSLTGKAISQILNYVLVADLSNIALGSPVKTSIIIEDKEYPCILSKESPNEFFLAVKASYAGFVSCWLRDLSDGYIRFDADEKMRIPGPFFIYEKGHKFNSKMQDFGWPNTKPYFIGISNKETPKFTALPPFTWTQENSMEKLRKTPLFDWHKQNGGKLIPFAGWEMPVWYTSVIQEHLATRKCAGLFDVSHMGVFQAEGEEAAPFLDSVCANDIGALNIGESCYTHFLTPNADVIDDLLVYYHAPYQYLLVVNASNDEKDWAWLNAVKSSQVLVDTIRPYAQSYGRGVLLRNLRDPKEGEDMRVDIALQGPNSKKILLNLGFNPKDEKKINALKRTNLCHASWSGYDLIISRTGYTGEKMAFEIFIHPEALVQLWKKLIEVGAPYGLKPCGLGARDSLRTEAGLPLYGHELGGELGLGIGEAGFSNYAKIYKPWFIGRNAFIERESKRKSVIARFKFENQRVRVAHLGDPVLNDRGRVIGVVTSCAIDTDEFLTGQAFIEKEYAAEGVDIYIYQGAMKLKDIKISQLTPGERTVLPTKAKIIERFAHL